MAVEFAEYIGIYRGGKCISEKKKGKEGNSNFSKFNHTNSVIRKLNHLNCRLSVRFIKMYTVDKKTRMPTQFPIHLK